MRVNPRYLTGEEENHTLIIVRRMLTEPKTALAGVMLETSFARFMASTAAFSKGMALSWRFVRWGLVTMVETGGSCESDVGTGRAEGPERS